MTNTLDGLKSCQKTMETWCELKEVWLKKKQTCDWVKLTQASRWIPVEKRFIQRWRNDRWLWPNFQRKINDFDRLLLAIFVQHTKTHHLMIIVPNHFKFHLKIFFLSNLVLICKTLFSVRFVVDFHVTVLELCEPQMKCAHSSIQH